MQIMQIAIVGCGYAGGAAALFLRRGGHDVAVFEAVDAPAPVGAGILIQPTGLAVLARLGLLESTLARAAKVGSLRMRSRTGRSLMKLRYEQLGSGYFGAGLHRGALFETIYEAVKAEIESLHLGVRIEQARREPARAGSNGGHTLIDSHGDPHGPFELVIVADGARSQIRDKGDIGRTTTYRWGAIWLVAPDPDNTFAGELYQTVDGTQKMMGLLPTGFGPGQDTVPLISLFWGLHEDAVDDWRRAGLAAFVDEINRYDPRAAPIVATIQDLDQLLFARYHRVVMRPWHRDGMVFIGDAGHAMSPQLGQGTNLALVDAMVLADCLDGATDLPAALARYSRERRAHIAYYELAAHALMPLFQSTMPGLGMLRDTLFTVLSRLPWVDGQMIRTMAGIKRGVIRPSMTLDLPLPLPPPGA